MRVWQREQQKYRDQEKARRQHNLTKKRVRTIFDWMAQR